LNFNVAGGADSVGIGLSSIHFPDAAVGPANLLRVNGGPWITIDNTNFPNLAIVGNGRGGYFRIDRPPGAPPITIVEIADPGDETLKFDHVAFTVATDPPRIIDITLSDEPLEATISWTSLPGKTYAVEFSTELDPRTWLELDDGVVADDETTSYTDNSALIGEDGGFYRVRDVP